MQQLVENNRIVKSIDLFKKSRDTRGTLHAKMGTIKNREVKDLTEANEIRSCGKNAQKNYTKNGHNNQDRDDAWITHIKPDIPEYEVKWALGSIIRRNARESDEIPAELFKIPKE